MSFDISFPTHAKQQVILDQPHNTHPTHS